MEIEQKQWTASSGWSSFSDLKLSQDAHLVLAFGDKDVLKNADRYEELRTFYPAADIVICSTAGEILDQQVDDGTISATAFAFAKTKTVAKRIAISEAGDSQQLSRDLSSALQGEQLKFVFVVSDGYQVNGTELTHSLAQTFDSCIVTGGLAGDGPNFKTTLVGLNEPPSEGNVVGIGFYGEHLKIGHAARGGWDPFGPERVVSKSSDNVLFELDNKSALDLYRTYLGDLAKDMPGSALLFPLGLRVDEKNTLVRTVLGVNDEDGSMTFAGNVPEGSVVRMMRSNFDRLVDGASGAASKTKEFGSFEPDVALVVSCAGRKFILQDRVSEEVQKIREVLGAKTKIGGFYAYGEISPLVSSTKCELHNQTMTITTLKEVV